MLKDKIRRPLAITMWEFSWLERRWPGAGYEDWDAALEALKARGYDAVRIDAFPHLVAAGPNREWELLPVWDQQEWGSPALTRVQVQPALNQFIARCREHGILVGLSTWFREDRDNMRMAIHTPQDLGAVWVATLDSIAADGLLDSLLYVDLCNEYPLSVWALWLRDENVRRASPLGTAWMRESIDVVRAKYPQLDYTFSFTTEYETWPEQDVSFLDFLEPHIWMAQSGDYYEKVGYHYERFDSTGYRNLQLNAERVYRENEAHWLNGLDERIDLCAAWSRGAKKMLMTTECWALVDYKDFPLLSWGYIKEMCEHGVKRAASTGRWVAIATSNFCGPQFVGMWRDVEWHRRLTDHIHNVKIEWE
ncbi:MAG: cellulase [Anaerolineae bacterium]|nr:cellulase [Anaerolineae bacterium]